MSGDWKSVTSDVNKFCCSFAFVGLNYITVEQLPTSFNTLKNVEQFVQSAKTNFNVEQVFFSIAREIKQRLVESDSKAEVNSLFHKLLLRMIDMIFCIDVSKFWCCNSSPKLLGSVNQTRPMGRQLLRRNQHAVVLEVWEDLDCLH